MQISTVERARRLRRFFSAQSSVRIVLTVVVLALVLAGCNRRQAEPTDTPPPPPPTDTPVPPTDTPPPPEPTDTPVPPTDTPEPEPTDTPEAEATDTPAPTPTPVPPTPTPAPEPKVSIPRGWTKVVNTDLGYSLAVPRGRLVLDIQKGELGQIMRFVSPAAAKQVEDALKMPGGEYAGHVAAELAIFSRPPIASLVGTGVVPLDGNIPADDVVEWLKGVLESFDMIPLNVQSLKAGTTNNLPAIQGVATADLSGQGLFNAHAVITALRANDKAYILLVAVPANQAKNKQGEIDLIVGTFRPE